ncbi:MAG TPA: peptidase M23, partial [Geobacteraceae bacterium]
MVLLICVLAVAAASGTCRADVKEELQGINKEIREKKLLLKKNRKVETQVSGELEVAEKRLREKEADLARLERDMKGVESNLEKTRQEMERVRSEADRKREQIRLRLASLYKAGEFGGPRVFFSSESLPQMMENMRYMKAVLGNDR